MNIKHLNDQALLSQTELLAKKERKLVTEILHHLQEIERRKLYSSLGLGSLFDYCMRKLDYSADQACRRIAAMRLMSEVPDVEAKLNSGELTLTHVGMAHTFFRREKKLGQRVFSKQEKENLLNKLSGCSTREAEREILKVSSVSPLVQSQSIRALPGEMVEVKFVTSEKVLAKLDHLRGLLAHKYPEMKLAELVEVLSDLGLKKWDLSRQSA